MLKAIRLGSNSGLRVSQLCLGTMNYGKPGRGHQGDWTLGAEDARPIFRAAIEHGLFYFDCADVYGRGASEEVVGKLLRELLSRDEYVLATKLAMPMGRGANQGNDPRNSASCAVHGSMGSSRRHERQRRLYSRSPADRRARQVGRGTP